MYCFVSIMCCSIVCLCCSMYCFVSIMCCSIVCLCCYMYCFVSIMCCSIACLCCYMYCFVSIMCCSIVCLCSYMYCLFVLFYVLFVCKCVLYYRHRVSTQLQLTNIYHIIFASQLRKKHGNTLVKVGKVFQNVQNRTYIIIIIHKHNNKYIWWPLANISRKYKFNYNLISVMGTPREDLCKTVIISG